MTELIDAKQVIAKLDEIVERKGADYVYHAPADRLGDDGDALEDIACFYSSRDGEPSCIVGYVAHDLAPDLFKSLVADDDSSTGSTVGNFDAFDEYFTFEAVSVLTNVQTYQDERTSWGTSVEWAKDDAA